MAAAALIIGTGISAYGSAKAGQEKKEAYEAESFAKQRQAAQVDVSAAREIELIQKKLDRTQSAQISSYGRSGVQLEGSPLLSLEQSAADAFDEINSVKQAAGYRKSTLLTESGFSKKLGDQAESAGYLGAAGSILTGFGKNPNLYDSGKKNYSNGNMDDYFGNAFTGSKVG